MVPFQTAYVMIAGKPFLKGFSGLFTQPGNSHLSLDLRR